ncbi:MAG: twin-arginine translocation signal domain-containing protein, partial [Olsenella sp.]|nr:twin-arginine translocation signal domain-containing protein [Olsenella sp.]
MTNLSRRGFLGATATAAAGLALAGCGGSGSSDGGSGSDSADLSRVASDDMIKSAKDDGELVVYGSCEEEYLAA